MHVPRALLSAIFDSTSQPPNKRWLAQFTGDRDGRGANGRRFVKTYSISAFRCPSLAARALGSGRQLIYGSGQGVQQAIGIDLGGRVIFDRAVLTEGGDFPGDVVKINVHADMWDFHLPDDFCPPTVAEAYLATDGGIDTGALPQPASALGSQQ